MKRLLSLMLARCLLAGCTSEPSSRPEEPESASSQSSSLPDQESESSSESELESSTAQSNTAPSQPAVTLAWWQQELSNEKLIATPDPILGYAPCGTPDGTYWIYDDTRKVSWLGYGLFARSSDTAETAPVALILDSAVEGCYMSGVGDQAANSIDITYDAIVTPVSEAVTNTAIASVLFIIAWDAV